MVAGSTSPGPAGFSGSKRQNSGAYSAVSVWSAVLKIDHRSTALPGGGTPMITTDAPAWLRRSVKETTCARERGSSAVHHHSDQICARRWDSDTATLTRRESSDSGSW